jgi:uncharacterized protein YecE (DUF72 family)
MTFYKFPRVEFLTKWYDRSPDDFMFSIKAPRVITHFKKLHDSRKYLNDFYTAVDRGLKGKAGCVLFQFPAQFELSAERLELIVEMLNPSFRNVVEFRHASWWKEEVYERLRNSRIIFSGMSHPNLPDSIVTTTSTLYHRMHGVPHLYASPYSRADLETLAGHVMKFADVQEAYIFFNNTIDGAAIVNGKQFQELVQLVH